MRDSDFPGDEGAFGPTPRLSDDSTDIALMQKEIGKLLDCSEFRYLDPGDKRSVGFAMYVVRNTKQPGLEVMSNQADGGKFAAYAKPKLVKKYGAGRVSDLKKGKLSGLFVKAPPSKR